VDEAHLEDPAFPALVQVVGDDVREITRRERVKVQFSRDGKDDRSLRVLGWIVGRSGHAQPPKRAAAAA
jgi:hypothetical protein